MNTMSKNRNTKNHLNFQEMRRRLIELDEQEKKSYYQQAQQKAKDVAGMLTQDYGVKQVYLYGSLVWGGFDWDSDIDLYLVGFEGNYWEAYCKAEAITSPIEVSLACEEDCVDSLKVKVLAEGELL